MPIGNLEQPPIYAPMVDPETGKLNYIWERWFQQMTDVSNELVDDANED